MPDETKCDEQVWRNGAAVLVTDLDSERMEAWVKQVREDMKRENPASAPPKIDWHYMGGRAVLRVYPTDNDSYWRAARAVRRMMPEHDIAQKQHHGEFWQGPNYLWQGPMRERKERAIPDDASLPIVKQYAEKHGWTPGSMMNSVEYLDHMVSWYKSHLENVRKIILEKIPSERLKNADPWEFTFVQEVRNILADREMFLKQRDGRLELTRLQQHGLLTRQEAQDPEKAEAALLKLSKAIGNEEEYERTNLLNVKLEGQIIELRGQLEVQRGREKQVLVLLKTARKFVTDGTGRDIDKWIREHA